MKGFLVMLLCFMHSYVHTFLSQRFQGKCEHKSACTYTCVLVKIRLRIANKLLIYVCQLFFKSPMSDIWFYFLGGCDFHHMYPTKASTTLASMIMKISALVIYLPTTFHLFLAIQSILFLLLENHQLRVGQVVSQNQVRVSH